MGICRNEGISRMNLGELRRISAPYVSLTYSWRLVLLLLLDVDGNMGLPNVPDWYFPGKTWTDQ